MTPLRCLIIDDERLARLELSALLSEAGDCEIIGEAAGASQAIALIRATPSDVIFLDINMPGANGFEILSQLEHCPLVVFVTAYDQYAIQAFEVHALDYLMKPVRPDRLAATLKLIRKRLGQSPGNRVFLPDRNGGVFVSLSELFLVRAYDHYVRLFHPEGSSMLHQSLGEFADRLPATDFFQANRSEFIRISAVKEVNKLSRNRYELLLPGDETVVVSERRSVAWRKQFSW